MKSLFLLLILATIWSPAFAESSDSDGGWIILAPVVIGIGLIIAGYRAFRYGEEVEKIDGKDKKAATGKGGSSQSMIKSLMSGNTDDLEGLMKTGMNFMEEIQEMQKS